MVTHTISAHSGRSFMHWNPDLSPLAQARSLHKYTHRRKPYLLLHASPDYTVFWHTPLVHRWEGYGSKEVLYSGPLILVTLDGSHRLAKHITMPEPMSAFRWTNQTREKTQWTEMRKIWNTSATYDMSFVSTAFHEYDDYSIQSLIIHTP